MHTVIDDPSRVAYAEIHDDEAAATAVLRNATPWLTDRGVTIQRVLSANGSAYRSHAWREACSELGSIPSGPGPTGLAACMTWFLCPYRPRQVEPVRQSLPGAGDQDAQHPTSDPCSRPLRRPGAIVRTSTEVTDRPGWGTAGHQPPPLQLADALAPQGGATDEQTSRHQDGCDRARAPRLNRSRSCSVGGRGRSAHLGLRERRHRSRSELPALGGAFVLVLVVTGDVDCSATLGIAVEDGADAASALLGDFLDEVTASQMRLASITSKTSLR